MASVEPMHKVLWRLLHAWGPLRQQGRRGAPSPRNAGRVRADGSRTPADFGRTRAKFDRCLGKLGRTRQHLARRRPIPTEFGTASRHSGRNRPLSNMFGRFRTHTGLGVAHLGRRPQFDPTWAASTVLPARSRRRVANFDQPRASSANCWAVSTKDWVPMGGLFQGVTGDGHNLGGRQVGIF